MSWSRRLFRSRAIQVAIGVAAAEYLRLVWKTGRFVTEPPDIYERVARDYPVIQAMILLTSAIYVTVNLLIDVAYTLLDPRIRY